MLKIKENVNKFSRDGWILQDMDRKKDNPESRGEKMNESVCYVTQATTTQLKEKFLGLNIFKSLSEMWRMSNLWEISLCTAKLSGPGTFVTYRYWMYEIRLLEKRLKTKVILWTLEEWVVWTCW